MFPPPSSSSLRGIFDVKLIIKNVNMDKSERERERARDDIIARTSIY
jgi:hypothetical protein